MARAEREPDVARRGACRVRYRRAGLTQRLAAVDEALIQLARALDDQARDQVASVGINVVARLLLPRLRWSRSIPSRSRPTAGRRADRGSLAPRPRSPTRRFEDALLPSSRRAARQLGGEFSIPLLGGVSRGVPFPSGTNIANVGRRYFASRSPTSPSETLAVALSRVSRRDLRLRAASDRRRLRAAQRLPRR